MKNKILSLFVGCLFLFTSCAVQAGRSLKKEFRKIVKVYVSDEDVFITASAIPITNDYFITAGHFCEAITAKFIDGILENDLVKIDYLAFGDERKTIEDVSIIDFVHNESNDICLLQKKNHNLPKVSISRYYSYLEFGDTVYTVGFPLGFFPAIITEGYVSSSYTQEYPETLNDKLMISSSAVSGNSGCGAFNKDGELVGLIVMVNPQYHNLVFAIPTPKILEYLDKFK